MQKPCTPATRATLTLLAGLAATALTGQCPLDWEHGDVGFGVVGVVHAMTEWDPDGAGPAPAQVVVGGAFIQAGAVRARNLALWDPQTQQFTSLATGANGVVRALAVDANNNLIVAGSFSTVDSTPAQSIARWDGSSWHPYGAGITGTVLALAHDASGDLIAGGSFGAAGPINTDNVARWNAGSGAWTAIGAGLQQASSPSTAEVRALAVLPNGNLIAGGVFDRSGSNTMRHMARWTGSSWVAHDTGLLIWDETKDLLALPNGDLIATGDGAFVSVIIKSGGVWTSATSTFGLPTAIMRTANNRIIAGRNGQLVELVNGSWQILTSLPSGFGTIDCLVAIPGGQPTDLVLGGNTPSNSLTRYQNGGLVASPSAIEGQLLSLETGSDGALYAGGNFTAVDGIAALHVAVMRNGSWQPLGNGLTGVVRHLVAISPQNVFALARALGAQVSSPYHWDGTSWQQLPGGPNRPNTAIGTMDGMLLVGGDTLALFDGSAWQTIPGARNILHLHQLPNGDIAASGFSDSILFQDRTGIWDGTSWTPTPGTQLVRKLSETPQGQLLLAGQFPNGDLLGFWDGSAWVTPTGITGFVYDMEPMPNGDTLVTGSLQLAGYGATQLAQWDGQNWSPAHPELELPADPSSNAIDSFEVLPDGSVAAQIGWPNNHIPILRSACPPTQTEAGLGCASSGGANRLSAEAWPLIGATYRAAGSELPTTCFVVDALGTATTSLALNTILPTALPGCVLHIDPLLLGGGTTTNGIYRAELSIPSSITLIGRAFHHQFIPVEIDANGNLADITATNAMTLTIGSF